MNFGVGRLKSILIVFSLLLLVTTYFFYRSQVTSTSKEIVANWLDAEAVNIQQGNLLVSIAKGYRLTNRSNNIRGIVVIDRKKSSVTSKLFSIGQELPIDRSMFDGKVLRTTTNLWGQVQVYKMIDPSKDIGIIFFVSPGKTVSIFAFFSIVIAILFLVCFILIDYTHKNETKIKERFYTIARQASHDIRSPLSTLSILRKKYESISGEEAQLIEKAITRIEEVAKDLLTDHQRALKKNTPNTTNTPKPLRERNSSTLYPKVRLWDIADEAINEKVIEFSNHPGVKFMRYFDNDCGELLVKINPSSLKRALSNLFNNSIEAKKTSKPLMISISLSKESDKALLEIRDNGQGISRENIEKVIEKGSSVNKPEGNGLGLSYAKDVVQQSSGSLKIFSQVDIGTTVQISLPHLEPDA